MSVRTLKGLLAFLQEHNLTPCKRASQHFLVDGNILDKIVKTAELSADDFVIEIGPGPGALTETLLHTGCSVLAIEKDKRLASLLTRLQGQRLHICAQDILQCPIEEHLQTLSKKAKVVANLPYHITTPILTKFLPLHIMISDLVIMMQKEVGKRCMALPNTKDYGSLTLFIQFFADILSHFTIAPSCFYPKPQVESMVLHLRLRPTLPVKDPQLLFQLIHTSFQQRRKCLTTSLRTIASAKTIEALLNEMHMSSCARPQELSLQAFIHIADALASNKAP